MNRKWILFCVSLCATFLLVSCDLFVADNSIPESLPEGANAANLKAPPCPKADALKDYGLVKKYPEICILEMCTDVEAPEYKKSEIEKETEFFKTYRLKVPEKFRAWQFIWQSADKCKYPNKDYCQHPQGHNCFEKDKDKCPQKNHCEFFLCESEMSVDNEKFREFEFFIKQTGGGKITIKKEECGKYPFVSKLKSPLPTTAEATTVAPTATATSHDLQREVAADKNVQVPNNVVAPVAVATTPAPDNTTLEEDDESEVVTSTTVAPTAAAPPKREEAASVAPSVHAVAAAAATTSVAPPEEVKVEFKSEVAAIEEKKLAPTVQSSVLTKMKTCIPPEILKDFTTNKTNITDFAADQAIDNCGCQFKLCNNPKFREYSELLVEEVRKYEGRCKAKYPLEEVSIISSNQCLNEEITIEKNISKEPIVMNLIVDNSAELSPWQTAKKSLLDQLDELMAVGVKLKIYALSQVNQKYDGSPQLLSPICEKKKFYAPEPVAEILINSQNSKDQISNLIAEGLQRVPAVSNFFYPAGICFINRLFDDFEKRQGQSQLIPQTQVVFLATHRDDFSNNVNAVNETYCFDSVAPKDPGQEKSGREIASQKIMNYYAKVRSLEFMVTVNGLETKTYQMTLDDTGQEFYDSLTNDDRECRSQEMNWMRQKEKITEVFKSCRIKRNFKKLLVTSSEVPEPNLCLFTCDQRPSFYLKGEGHDCFKNLAKQKYTMIDDYRYVTCERDDQGSEILRSTPLCAANPLVGTHQMLAGTTEILKRNQMIKDQWKFLIFNSASESCSNKGLKFSKNYSDKFSEWKNSMGVDVRTVNLCDDAAASNLTKGLSELIQESTQGLNYPINIPVGSKIEKITLLSEEQKLIVPSDTYKVMKSNKGGTSLQFTSINMRKTIAGFQKIIITYSPTI